MSRTDYALVSVAALCLVIAIATVPRFADHGGVLGIIGVVVGVVLGLLGDRWLRHSGDVHCQIEDFQITPRMEGRGPAHLRVEQSVRIHFFNKKEVDTGLSEIAVVSVLENGQEVVLGPGTRGYETSTSPRGVTNLPSKTWVSVHIKGYFFGPPAKLLDLEDPKAIEVKGKFPGGKPYHKRCSSPTAVGDEG
jgi:hypothetical protein